ncbi:MAG: glycosyltransferase family 9 protein, partial [Candidatus Omnitrophica bacterium]|nr:glycosyltransferase family 9 protein [Candidatus Omnitrophota bacterium]
MPRKYAYKNPGLLRMARFADAASAPLARFFKRPEPDREPKVVLAIRLDHIGDQVLSVPALKALKAHYPYARIVLATTRHGYELLTGAGIVDETIVVPFSGYGTKTSLAGQILSVFRLSRVIRRVKPGRVFDLRGDARVILAARIAAPRVWLAGFGDTGGSFLLSFEPARDLSLAAWKRPFALLPGARPESFGGPDRSIAAEPLDPEILRRFKKVGRFVVALHVGAGTAAKLWPKDRWKGLIHSMARKYPDAGFVLIGDESARLIADLLVRDEELRPYAARIQNLCTEVRLGQIGTLFEEVRMLITTDSAPAHLAATRSLKTLGLFS